MTLIKQLNSPLPFQRLTLGYSLSSSPQKPFYFQRGNCINDCFYGNISHDSHIPNFITQVEDGLTVNDIISIEVKCTDGSDSISLTANEKYSIQSDIVTGDFPSYGPLYTGNNFSVIAEIATVGGSTFDGTHYWVVDGASNIVYKYTQPGVYTGTNFDTSLQCSAAGGITWDGTFFYVVCDGSDTVYRYDSAGVYTGFSFSVAAVETITRGLCFDGSNIWVTGPSTDSAYEFTLGGVYTGNSFSISSEDSAPNGMEFDGRYFWIVGGFNNRVYKYNSDGTYTGKSFSNSSQSINMRGIAFDGNNITLFSTNSKIAYKYDRLTAATLDEYVYTTDTEEVYFYDGSTFVLQEFLFGDLILNQTTGEIWAKTNSGLLKTINGLQIYNDGECNYMISSGFEINEVVNCGLKNIFITTPNFVYISELIEFKSFDFDNHEYHKLEVTSDCNIGDVPYEFIGYNPSIYLEGDTIVGSPDHSIDEEKEEDGLGIDRSIYKKFTKIFNLDTDSIPEYIIDFIFFATMNQEAKIEFPFVEDNIDSINNQYKGIRCIDTDNFEVTNNWIETECYGSCTIKMALSNPIIKTSCC